MGIGAIERVEEAANIESHLLSGVLDVAGAKREQLVSLKTI